MATKERSKTENPNRRRPSAKTSPVKHAQTNAELRQQLAESLQREKATAKDLQECKRQRSEDLEQKTALSEILRVIASSPTDLQPVLDTLAVNAARVCSADDVVIWRVEGNLLRRVAHHGSIPLVQAPQLTIDRESVLGRAVVDRQLNHIEDLLSVAPVEFPRSVASAERNSIRTILVTPLLRDGVPIGTILMRRLQVSPFTEEQIALLRTFADQAVIAIENVRLFNEVQERNRDLAEAFKQQTATSEVLKVISRSTFDLQVVLDILIENATKLCDASQGFIHRFDGEVFRTASDYGEPLGFKDYWQKNVIRPGRGSATGRVALEHRTVHISDVLSDPEYELIEAQRLRGFRTVLAVPMLRDGILFGVMIIHRTEVRPFTDKHIDLVTTFADQAVIAIENVRLFQELRESLEQQTATSEILGVIASSLTDIQPVLDVVAENAARVCGANDAVIFRVNANVLDRAAHYGPIFWAGSEESLLVSRGSVNGRAVIDRQTVHIHDMAAEAEAEFPKGLSFQRRTGHRTVLATPLLREGTPIGTIMIRRTEVRPFSDKQIKLLETFASQAVIAIENVRLFKEIQERNAELHETLEHQTATAEVLSIISRSPSDVQPVLDAIVESAAKVCGVDDVVLRLREGDVVVARAHIGPVPIASSRVELNIDRTPHFRWVRDHGTLHVPDSRAAQGDFSEFGVASGFRSFLATPLRLQGEFIELLIARRAEVRPFTPTQTKLLETFADQAVIAIENVRLFQELKESLEQQTATSEILGVIASSPTDVQPVLDVVAENAARLCDSSDAQIYRVEADVLRKVASRGIVSPVLAVGETRPISRAWLVGQAILQRDPVHIHDSLAVLDEDYAETRRADERLGIRTLLAVPLLREGVAIGAIMIRRTEVRPFTDKQIGLLKTFADQAVIAIENVRLFKELGERNAELREALEHQTATAEVLGIISRSPTEVQPVLDAIVESAARVCGIDDVVLRLREEEVMVVRAHLGSVPLPGVEIGVDAPPVRWVREHGTLHIPDIRTQNDIRLVAPGPKRTLLFVPLRLQGELTGILIARRTEVRPFTPAQIKLLETFADQAVIAIENVRLFQELKESLEQQTATSEILGVIASSPTDIQPVLDTIAQNAVRVCAAEDAQIRLVEGNVLRWAAHTMYRTC